MAEKTWSDLSDAALKDTLKKSKSILHIDVAIEELAKVLVVNDPFMRVRLFGVKLKTKEEYRLWIKVTFLDSGNIQVGHTDNLTKDRFNEKLTAIVLAIEELGATFKDTTAITIESMKAAKGKESYEDDAIKFKAIDKGGY